MTNATTRRRQLTRKSLRQSLKELLQRRRRQTKVFPGQVGSGILRKGDFGNYLPEPSRVSLFPNFESTTQFDIDSYSVHIPNHFASQSSFDDCGESISSTPFASRTSLLPARSLSYFNLKQSYAEQGRPYRPTQLSTVPEVLVEGVSRHASLVSLQSLQPSRSTLRIRESNQSLRSNGVGRRETTTELAKPRSSRLRASRKELRGVGSFQSLKDCPACPKSPAQTGDSASVSERASTGNPSIASIKHFGSFCVLDTNSPGCPVTATSEDLKFVFDVGEHYFLNNQECTGASLDIVTGFDADGNEVTHLLLFSPLISPSSGRSRFLLAALIDVTFFIKDAAVVPELDTLSEESVFDDGIATPVYRHPPSIKIHESSPKPIRYELSCEDLLGGCYIDDEDRGLKSYSPISDHRIASGMELNTDSKNVRRSTGLAIIGDVWTDLANEEMILDRKTARASAAASTGSSGGRCSPHSSSPSLSTPSTSSTTNVDEVLDSFMAELQKLYSAFFLLSKSPLDAGFYEICNVSPSVYVSKDYVHGHLSHSSRDTITRLSEQLGGDRAFDMNVRWGISGEVKQLYCIPLFGQRDLTWICMLVDEKLGSLW